MKKITIEMPEVLKCEVTECSYNTNESCHARAITVGDGAEPHCDTYFQYPLHSKNDSTIAGVGACKVVACHFNNDFECEADSIQVGYENHEAYCLTFTV